MLLKRGFIKHPGYKTDDRHDFKRAVFIKKPFLTYSKVHGLREFLQLVPIKMQESQFNIFKEPYVVRDPSDQMETLLISLLSLLEQSLEARATCRLRLLFGIT